MCFKLSIFDHANSWKDVIVKYFPCLEEDISVLDASNISTHKCSANLCCVLVHQNETRDQEDCLRTFLKKDCVKRIVFVGGSIARSELGNIQKEKEVNKELFFSLGSTNCLENAASRGQFLHDIGVPSALKFRLHPEYFDTIKCLLILLQAVDCKADGANDLSERVVNGEYWKYFHAVSARKRNKENGGRKKICKVIREGYEGIFGWDDSLKTNEKLALPKAVEDLLNAICNSNKDNIEPKTAVDAIEPLLEMASGNTGKGGS